MGHYEVRCGNCGFKGLFRIGDMASAGYAKRVELAAKLAETEKFGFTEQYQILIDSINNKIGANSPLKTWILETNDVMVKSSGYVESALYDKSLIDVYNKLLT